MRIVTCISVLVMISMFAGCVHNTKQKHQAVTARKAQEVQARLADIPIPLGAEPYGQWQQENNGQMTMRYVCSAIDLDALIFLYEQEMERLGWQQQAIFVGQESLLMFSKPTRFCTIFVKDFIKSKRNHGLQITIFIGPYQVSH